MDKLHINGMSLNQNKTLITLATDRGYRIIDTFKFNTVSEVNDIMELIGPLQFSSTYYESNIILFVGTEDNLNFPPNQIALWDDSRRKKIGLIMLKTNVIDLKLTKKNLFVFVNNKVILFDFMTLEYITSINDVTSDNKLMSISTKINPIILAFMDSKSKRKINIIRLFSNVENSRIIGKTHKFIISKFENSQYIKLSKTGEFISEVSGNGCRINLYSLLDFEMKKSFWRGQSNANILGLAFSRFDRFMAIFSNTLTVHIFSLEDIEKNLVLIDNKLCNNEGAYLDDSCEMLEESYQSYTNMFTKIKDFIINSNSSFCQYKFNFNEISDDINNYFNEKPGISHKESYVKITETDYQVIFFFNKTNEITIVDTKGVCEKLKFDTKKNGLCWNLNRHLWTGND